MVSFVFLLYFSSAHRLPLSVCLLEGKFWVLCSVFWVQSSLCVSECVRLELHFVIVCKNCSMHLPSSKSLMSFAAWMPSSFRFFSICLERCMAARSSADVVQPIFVVVVLVVVVVGWVVFFFVCVFVVAFGSTCQ